MSVRYHGVGFCDDPNHDPEAPLGKTWDVTCAGIVTRLCRKHCEERGIPIPRPKTAEDIGDEFLLERRR